ncbi:MAG: hypothetical protein AVDCRST_MAG27-2235, partial [uncultured Craurococcus sp.]
GAGRFRTAERLPYLRGAAGLRHPRAAQPATRRGRRLATGADAATAEPGAAGGHRQAAARLPHPEAAAGAAARAGAGAGL